METKTTTMEFDQFASCRIYWSTQSGRAKACARRTARILSEQTPELSIVGGSIGSPFDGDDVRTSSFVDLLLNGSTNTAATDNSSATLFLMFVSTTGDGEQCDTIRNTWNALLSKSLKHGCLADSKDQFALFCLGDRAYGPQFCAAGRKLGVRLLQLGMKNFCDVGYGDDDTPQGGVFRDLDTWLESVLLPKIIRMNTTTTTTAAATMTETTTAKTLTQQQQQQTCPYRIQIIPKKEREGSEGSEESKASDDNDDVFEATAAEEEYLNDSYYLDYFTDRGPVTAYAYYDNPQQGRKIERINKRSDNAATSGGRTAPLIGTVIVNDRITANDWKQNTRHLEIDLRTTMDVPAASTSHHEEESIMKKESTTTPPSQPSPTISAANKAALPYQAGDVASILPFNSKKDVDRFLKVLPKSISSLADSTLQIELDDSYANDNRYTRWPNRCTLRGWLTYCADIQGLLEREDLRALSYYCASYSSPADDKENDGSTAQTSTSPAATAVVFFDQGEKLRSMSETSESALYADYVLREKRSWIDVFHDFDSLRREDTRNKSNSNSTKLTLEALLMLLPPMRTRDFSIASSPTMMDIVKKKKQQQRRRNNNNHQTISSSSSFFSIELCIAVVEGTTRFGRSYHGLCSEFLSRIDPAATEFSLQQEDQQSQSNSNSQKLMVWIRPGTFGKMPLGLKQKQQQQKPSSSFEVPIICVGAGTGIAPMRSLVLERMAVRLMAINYNDQQDSSSSSSSSKTKEQEEEKNDESIDNNDEGRSSSSISMMSLLLSSSSNGGRNNSGNSSSLPDFDENENIVVYGSRKRNADFYYQKEWETLTKNNNNIRLLTAFSQDQNHKLYVQKVLRDADDKLLIAKHVLEKNGAVYVAGNPKMARAVKQEIVEAITDVLLLSSSTQGSSNNDNNKIICEKQANKILTKLQRIGKFGIEAW